MRLLLPLLGVAMAQWRLGRTPLMDLDCDELIDLCETNGRPGACEAAAAKKCGMYGDPSKVNTAKTGEEWIEELILPRTVDDPAAGNPTVIVHTREDLEYVIDVRNRCEAAFNAEHGGTPDDSPFTNGDTLLTPAQIDYLCPDFVNSTLPSRKKRNVNISPLAPKWTPTVSYKFATDAAADPELVALFHETAAFLSGVTCLNLVHNHPSDNYILVDKQGGCSSSVGMVGGAQAFHLGPGCVTHAIIAHELEHALGLLHEQSRADRDEYVTINFANVETDKKHNFDMCTTCETFGHPYDYSSNMHYGAYFFAVDPAVTTVIAKDPNYQESMGRASTSGFYEIMALNKRYCTDTCAGATPACQRGGYPNPQDCTKCLCPLNIGGDFCDEAPAGSPAACGEALTATSVWQEIETPGYPTNMPAGQECYWLLTAPAGSRIEFQFIGTVLGGAAAVGSGCYNYIEVQTSADPRLPFGTQFCPTPTDQSPPATIVESEGDVIIVHFNMRRDAPGWPLAMKAQFRILGSPDVTGEDCEMSDWGAWGPCSNACGAGDRTRSRTIVSEAVDGGVSCEQMGTSETGACEGPCDCVYSDWGAWGECSQTCGPGTHGRSRTVVSEAGVGGVPCDPMELTASEGCENACDCELTVWSAWSNCSEECGPGNYTRNRTIVSEASGGGVECSTMPLEGSEGCENACDCIWSEWGAWICDVECGAGTQNRSRSVARIESGGGVPCEGEASESEACVPGPCPPNQWCRQGQCKCDDGFYRIADDDFCQEVPCGCPRWGGFYGRH